MERRGFLAGILAAGFAPAFVGSGVLMPVRSIALPGSFVVHMTTRLGRYPLHFHRYADWTIPDGAVWNGSTYSFDTL